MSYHKYALWLHNKLETIKLKHVPRSANKVVNALVYLTAHFSTRVAKCTNVTIDNQWVMEPFDEELKEDISAVSAQGIEEEN